MSLRRTGPSLSRLLVVLLFIGAGTTLGCGHSVKVRSPDVSYYFGHPLLNEDWKPGAVEAEKKQSKNRSHRKATAEKNGHASKRKRASDAVKSSAAVRTGAPPAQELRGNEVEVVRKEMVLAAQRLVGIKDSFTQDSFLRHVLTVNNFGGDSMPAEGTVAWLHGQVGKEARVLSEVKPGDLLFLGEDDVEMCVVVEEVEDNDRITFIGALGDEVKRGNLSLSQRSARRDETSGKVLNTFVDRTRLAGGMLLGGLSLSRHTRVAGNE